MYRILFELLLIRLPFSLYTGRLKYFLRISVTDIDLTFEVVVLYAQ